MNKDQLLLYAVTDRSYLHGITLTDACEQAILGGITMLQLREKKLDIGSVRREAAALKELCAAYGIPFIIDDNVMLAKELDLDGVHLGQSDMPADKARQILGPDKIIGVTAKNISQAEKAKADGADYLGSGAMFATSTKPGAKPMTPKQLSEITARVDIPVAAIGGITRDNIGILKGTGVCGAAISEAIFASPDICSAASDLKIMLTSLLPDHPQGRDLQV